MKVITFVVKVEDYHTALVELDEKVNSFIGANNARHLILEDSNAIQDTLYPPIRNGDLPRLARRVVYKTIWRS